MKGLAVSQDTSTTGILVAVATALEVGTELTLTFSRGDNVVFNPYDLFFIRSVQGNGS